jgi:murein DD-endopeptidase MepM/ murein hydrolase activator NlpD
MATSRQQYIDQYAGYAMEQMRRYGIPASVTLAQGIIESANGQSYVASTANNHFGVKGTYNGNYVLANDDRPNEKFKKYDNVSQSYEDHSKVLMASRYQKYTKNLSPDDYAGWVRGIKAGGYASDPRYVSTVVGVIESNNLQRYDQMVMAETNQGNKQSQTESTTSSLKSTGMNLPDGNYSMPVKRDSFMLITSPYGKRKDPLDSSKTEIHHGIDIKTKGDAVLATENNGKVIATNHNENKAGGKSITVEYTRADGTKTQVQYMHLSEINIRQGDTVNAGQKLGVSGNTGSRTTGEHLHFGVINVSADGKRQWVNPAAYLAEISQKGNIRIEAQHNGKDLLAQYQAGGIKVTEQKQEAEQTPESWMNKLLSSPDAALGGFSNGEGQGLTGSLMHMLMLLLMVAMQQEGKSKEEKMQALTDAAVNRKIDLSSMVTGLKSAELSITNNGKTILTTSDGKQQFTHELTESEKTRISQILSSDSDDATKRQKISSMVMAITVSQQASRNYEQIEAQQSQSLELQSNVQRK